MGYKLDKGYTESEKENFIVEYNHNQGLLITENDYGIFATADSEEIQNGDIVDISNTDEYKAKIAEKEKATNIVNLNVQIDALDKKRIRAIAEPSIKDTTTGQTWLEYYTLQIQNLRQQITGL